MNIKKESQNLCFCVLLIYQKFSENFWKVLQDHRLSQIKRYFGKKKNVKFFFGLKPYRDLKKKL